MRLPLQITFHGVDASEALEAAARAKAEKLERFCPEFTACRVHVEQAARHAQQGRPFSVKLDVTMPGHEFVVGRQQHEDAYVALRDAFDAMRRQIEDAMRRLHGQVKTHPVPLHGELARLVDDGRYGFIRGADGEEYYFGADNVVDTPWQHLREGLAVQFVPDLGAEGRQARRVSLGKHGIA